MGADRVEHEVAQSDVRWLLVIVVVFATSVALCYAALLVYRATGPHPEMLLLTRRLKRLARWLLPRLR